MKEDPEEIIPILLPPDLKNRDELVGLYSSALDTLDLAAADYLTIGDITDLSGCHDTALHALLIAMFDMLDRGGLCLALDRQSLHDKLSRFVRDAEIMARRIEQKIDSWGDVICFIDGRDERPSSPPEFKPLVCCATPGAFTFKNTTSTKAASSPGCSVSCHRRLPPPRAPAPSRQTSTMCSYKVRCDSAAKRPLPTRPRPWR
jgi:hypothetical protein